MPSTLSLLTTFSAIIQEVNAADDITTALQIIVQRIREFLDTQAASIFLIDEHRQEFVLMATEGLNESAVGLLRIPVEKGLVGLVGRREEPINLEDAPMHPDFFHHEQAGEEDFHAFLGVPVIHQRRLYGVLAVQQEDVRRYDETEEAILVTLCAQLAGIIANAVASGELAKLTPFRVTEPSQGGGTITGIPSSHGVGLGQAVLVYPPADLDAVPDRQTNDPAGELELLKEALAATRSEINTLSARLQATLPPDELDLFDFYLSILDSESLYEKLENLILQGDWAQGALRKTIQPYEYQLEAVQDPYISERASDFRDLGRRILSHLQANQPPIIDYPPNTILVGEEVSAANLAEVPEGQLKGIVSFKGANYSHVAILARALGIPTVMGAAGAQVADLENKFLVVDGYFGLVYLDPSPTVLEQFQKISDEEDELDESLEALRNEPAETPDGHQVNLYVNTGLAGDAARSLSVGADGVGLFRTEVPFMTRERFPAEEEQRVIYRQLLQAFMPRPVIMRTLDVGGDKTLPYFSVTEENPFLGWRGIRITLDHPEVFLVQLRAMLRASIDLNNLLILLPMISGVGELEDALALIEQAYQEILEDTKKVKRPLIGAMIEVPSAVYQARDIAKRVDFLSVGTNDLTQYLLAVDRNNTRVASLYDSYHPAVLQALIQVVEGGHSEGKRVSICGEMASDPVAIILLLAMGFDSMSMSSSSLPRIKWVIRNFELAAARKLLGEILEMDNGKAIRLHCQQAIDEAGLGELIRAGYRE